MLVFLGYVVAVGFLFFFYHWAFIAPVITVGWCHSRFDFMSAGDIAVLVVVNLIAFVLGRGWVTYLQRRHGR